MYKACIFDLDGTLTDTLDSLTFSVNETLKQFQLQQITKEQCRTFVGNGAKVLIEKSLKAVGDESLSHMEEVFALYGTVLANNCTYEVKPYPGVVQLLHELKCRGLKLGVLSNKPDQQAIHVVRTIFGEGLFDYVQGQRTDVPRKPDPTAAIEMANRFQVNTEQIVYIGDSEVDAATGKAAGMSTILVDWGFRSREELEKTEVQWIVSSTDEILDIIGKEENDR